MGSRFVGTLQTTNYIFENDPVFIISMSLSWGSISKTRQQLRSNIVSTFGQLSGVICPSSSMIRTVFIPSLPTLYTIICLILRPRMSSTVPQLFRLHFLAHSLSGPILSVSIYWNIKCLIPLSGSSFYSFSSSSPSPSPSSQYSISSQRFWISSNSASSTSALGGCS